jgi:hypothetical protein
MRNLSRARFTAPILHPLLFAITSTFRVNGLMEAASEQAAEQERLAAAKLETFRINGLMEAASEQAVGTKMGTVGQIN